jgi:hypothetical protein
MTVKEMSKQELNKLAMFILSNKKINSLYLTDEGKKWIINIMNGK